MSYEAFLLSESTRQMLLSGLAPKYPEVILHHVTHQFGVPKNNELPYGEQANCRVYGFVEDDGIEALLVEIDGQRIRPDGKAYHITFSLDREKGWKPVDSNKIIAEKPWTMLRLPIMFNVTFQYVE